METLSPEDKAQYESSLASVRMVEAETLAKKGKLDQASEKKINQLLSEHTFALNNALNKINQPQLKEKADKIINNFNDKMNAHAESLDSITAHASNNKGKIYTNNQVSNSARMNAIKITNILKNENGKQNNQDLKDIKQNTGDAINHVNNITDHQKSGMKHAKTNEN